MFCSVFSAAIAGVEAVPVSVEADVSDGLPVFTIVGYVSSQVREAQDRVRTALRNVGFCLPPKRITINLSPGDLRKEGTRFDLPIAAAVLMAAGAIRADSLDRTLLVGELHLDGRTAHVTGILPTVMAAREAGCTACIIPLANDGEGRVVDGIRVIGIESLPQLIRYCRDGTVPSAAETGKSADFRENAGDNAAPAVQPDFSDIRGQAGVKRAALIAAAGFHNLLLSGPPGSGKSMAAQRIPTILPDLTAEESLEISKIYSIAGLLPKGIALMKNRPFRAPHHTITAAALCGGGLTPHPGEVTLAHRGVLFLDELPEMNPRTLEMLRQPIEEHRILVARARGSYVFPASFLLVAAMNPCPCGYYPDRKRCTCTPVEIRSYQSRISQAFLDRIDLRCEVPAASYADLTGESVNEISSAQMRLQVEKAAAIQAERYKGTGILFNSELNSRMIGRYCDVSTDAEMLMQAAYRQLGLSARGYHRIIRTARTIADLDGSEVIKEAHISEALMCRCGKESPH